ncbi:MAG: exodeoxyribonuclease VII large subunit [Clostridia bacterium]|nr:exodeoxyribonuclease VII large subunit [Clostridia bacterium]
MDNAISVSQLNAVVHNAIAGERGLQNVVVYGEISSFKYSGAHAYFTLKDESAQIACNLFYAKKTYNPTKDGEAVIVSGYVDFYAKNGKLSLNVNVIQPVGKGALHVKLEQLKKKLEREGLFDRSRKKAIPPFCKKICVVTSATGAVIRDIVMTVRNKNKLLDIHVYDVRVQGESAANDMINALKTVDALGYDCLVLARGGGSFEDLMPFNDEGLARCIADLDTPIVSAVGHETDFSISDFVADARAATPTAAAELVAINVDEFVRGVKAELYLLNSSLVKLEEKYTKRVKTDIEALKDKSLRKFDNAESKTRMVLEKLSSKTESLLLSKERRLEKTLDLLNAANPTKLLKNGYFRVWNKGKSLDFNEIKIGDELTVRALQGSIVATVKEINVKKG